MNWINSKLIKALRFRLSQREDCWRFGLISRIAKKIWSILKPWTIKFLYHPDQVYFLMKPSRWILGTGGWAKVVLSKRENLWLIAFLSFDQDRIFFSALLPLAIQDFSLGRYKVQASLRGYQKKSLARMLHRYVVAFWQIWDWEKALH